MILRKDAIDVATLITIWIIGFQYLFNQFLRPSLLTYYSERKAIAEAIAKEKVAGIARKVQYVILMAFLAAVAIATYGWFWGAKG
jgi:hypothetical protein